MWSCMNLYLNIYKYLIWLRFSNTSLNEFETWNEIDSLAVPCIFLELIHIPFFVVKNNISSWKKSRNLQEITLWYLFVLNSMLWLEKCYHCKIWTLVHFWKTPYIDMFLSRIALSYFPRHGILKLLKTLINLQLFVDTSLDQDSTSQDHFCIGGIHS